MDGKNTMILSDESLWEESRDTELRLSLLRLFSLGATGPEDDRVLVRPLSAPFDGNRSQTSLHDLLCLKHRRSTSGSSLLSIDKFQRKTTAPSSNIDIQRQELEMERERHIRPHGAFPETKETQDNPDLIGMSSISSHSRKIAQRGVSAGCDRECDATLVKPIPPGTHPSFPEAAAVSENFYVVNDKESFGYAQPSASGVSILDTALGWRSSDLDRKRFEQKFDYFPTADTLLTIGNPSTVTFPYGPIIASVLPVRPLAPVAGTILKQHPPPYFAPFQLTKSTKGNDELQQDFINKSKTEPKAISERDNQRFATTMPSASGRPGGPPVENGEALQYDNTNHNRSNGGRVPVRAQTSSSSDVHRTASLRNGTSSIIDEDPNAVPNEGAAQPTPLFERLVTEEVQELRAYVRIVENQNRRLVELERVHGDLETRLEVESKNRQQLEATLEAREREWAEKLDHVERDRDQWKLLVEAEKIKNSKLIDQVVRKDQDIHRMLQRKYDTEITRSTRNARGGGAEQREKPRSATGGTSSKSPEVRTDAAHKSPHQILAAAGSAEKVRNRNAKSLLMDFFGI